MAPSEIEAYWTDKTMALAQPIEADIDEEHIQTLMAAEPWTQEGPPTVMESQLPDGSSVGDHRYIRDISNTFKTTPVRKPDRDNMLYSTVGKMFMTFNGKNFVGTGWVIAEKTVFTAGHCVFDKKYGGRADNILFVPQYEDGAAPVEKWSAVTIHSLQGWTESRNFKCDMAVFVTDQPARPKTGSLGWMANHAPNQGPYESVGFPDGAIPGYNFNGCHMWQSAGGYIQGSNPIQMHNNMTGGCS